MQGVAGDCDGGILGRAGGDRIDPLARQKEKFGQVIKPGTACQHGGHFVNGGE